MELIDSYNANSGKKVEIYGGVIHPEHLRSDDELQLQIGRIMLRGTVISEGEKPEIDMLATYDGEHHLGVHKITNKAIDGQWENRPGVIIKDNRVYEIQFHGGEKEVGMFVPRRKPFPMGIEFRESVQRQGIDISALPFSIDRLAQDRVRRGFPLVMRRK